MKRLVIVGAGISGLAAAQTAVRGAEKVPGGLSVTVLERDARVGGKVRTIREDGWCIEAGPTGYLDSEADVRVLADSVGVTPIGASKASARRFLVRRGKLAEIKASPIGFARSGILGPLGMARILAEPFIRRRRDPEEESIWSFAARRLGKQAADRLIAPMTLGVFAGDAKRLSLEASFTKLHEIESEHGSLIRGLIARRKRKNTGGPSGPAGWLTSFEEGLEELPVALSRAPGIDVRLDAAVKTIRRGDDSAWQVIVDGDTEPVPADAVLLSGEPWAMTTVLEETVPEAASNLAQIPCPPVIVVALGFGPEVLDKAPRGFGALIARDEGFRILGCLWDTHLFPKRSPEGHLLLRAMLGGSVDVEVADLADDAILDCVRADLKRLLGIAEPPLLERIVRWPRAIPQYEIGHIARRDAIESALAAHPGLFMAGNALHGIAFSKAAVLGINRGKRALDYLAG